MSDNPRGFFEPREVIQLNQAILREQGDSGYDLTLRRRADDAKKADWIARIRAYLATLPAAPIVVIKEPKLTAVSDLWFEAADLAGFDVATVIAVRHPQEVIGSLGKRARGQRYVRSSPELVSAWWLKYTLLAEGNTRGVPRVFVEYTNLLADWRREVKRISTALAIHLEAQDQSVIDAFLTPELRHHEHRGPVTEPFGTDWISAVYEALSAAARDEAWDELELDRVAEAYGACERGFRMAFDDYQRYRRLNRFMPPFVVKMGLEALAIAHRRKGTWA